MTYLACALLAPLLLLAGVTLAFEHALFRVYLDGIYGEKVSRKYAELVSRADGIRRLMILLGLFAILCWPLSLTLAVAEWMRVQRAYYKEVKRTYHEELARKWLDW